MVNYIICFVVTPSNVNGCTSIVTFTTTVTSRETTPVVSSTSIKPSTTLQITGTATVTVTKTVTPAEGIALSSHSSTTRLFSPTTTPASKSIMVIATSVTSVSVTTCAEGELIRKTMAIRPFLFLMQILSHVQEEPSLQPERIWSLLLLLLLSVKHAHVLKVS